MVVVASVVKELDNIPLKLQLFNVVVELTVKLVKDVEPETCNPPDMIAELPVVEVVVIVETVVPANTVEPATNNVVPIRSDFAIDIPPAITIDPFPIAVESVKLLNVVTVFVEKDAFPRIFIPPPTVKFFPTPIPPVVVIEPVEAETLSVVLEIKIDPPDE